MLKQIRKTLTGQFEYWDTEKKLVVIGGADLAKETTEPIDTETDINLDDMNVEQLLAFAEQNNIDVPGNMKKVETIRNHIAEELAADE